MLLLLFFLRRSCFFLLYFSINLNSVCVTNVAIFLENRGRTCWKLKFVTFFAVVVDKFPYRLCHKIDFQFSLKHVSIRGKTPLCVFSLHCEQSIGSGTWKLGCGTTKLGWQLISSEKKTDQIVRKTWLESAANHSDSSNSRRKTARRKEFIAV